MNNFIITTKRLFSGIIFLFVIGCLIIYYKSASAGGFGPNSGDLWYETFCLDKGWCEAGDFNGDGKDDIITFMQNPFFLDWNDVYVSLSTGANFSTYSYWLEDFCPKGEWCEVGDFNGDGKDDIVTFRQDNAGNDVFVALSTGTEFSGPTKWHGFFCLDGEWCGVGDFNGDGKDDIVTFTQEQAGNDVYIALSTGDNFSESSVWHGNFCHDDEWCGVGDFNGDGKDDIVTFLRGSLGDVYVALSTGTKFSTSSIWNNSFCLDEGWCEVGDFNGDNKDDIVTFMQDPFDLDWHAVYVSLSTGIEFSNYSYWHENFCVDGEWCKVGNFNGDSKDDIVSFTRGGSGDVLVALADNLSTPEPPEFASQFGYNNYLVGGTRPLLVVLEDVPNSASSFDHGIDFYDSLIFGPETPNVDDYFVENSYGKFGWERVDVIGPLEYPNGDDTAEQRFATTILMIADTGFNFSAYDANDDGIVTESELSILIIDDISINMGAVRGTDPGCITPPGSNVDVCMRVAGIGEGTSLLTAAHELAHLLGARDLYGSACLSQNLTLMGCTGGSIPDLRDTYHLDPWHKIQFGWVRPRVYRMTDPGTNAYLEAVQFGAIISSPEEEPIILYDPYQGTKEFFIVEFRSPEIPEGGIYDADVAGQGIAVWYIKTDADHNLLPIKGLRLIPGDDGILQSLPAEGSDDVIVGGNYIDTLLNIVIPDLDNSLLNLSGGSEIWAGADRILQSNPAEGSDDKVLTDNSNFVVGAPNALRGINTLWNNSNGYIPLQLQINEWWDTEGNNIHLHVGPISALPAGVDAEWGYLDPFTPWIEFVSSNSNFSGSLINISGNLGVFNSNRVVSLKNEDETYDMQVISWNSTQVIAQIPIGITAGNYDVIIYDDSSKATSSNWVSLYVEEGKSIFLPIVIHQ